MVQSSRHHNEDNCLNKPFLKCAGTQGFNIYSCEVTQYSYKATTYLLQTNSAFNLLLTNFQPMSYFRYFACSKFHNNVKKQNPENTKYDGNIGKLWLIKEVKKVVNTRRRVPIQQKEL